LPIRTSASSNASYPAFYRYTRSATTADSATDSNGWRCSVAGHSEPDSAASSYSAAVRNSRVASDTNTSYRTINTWIHTAITTADSTGTDSDYSTVRCDTNRAHNPNSTRDCVPTGRQSVTIDNVKRH
jgi:hypothetical protein